jgi:poly-gamma-glutamate capsule biosynthesis protein CapA/YwtB (metallophosphatase superfamily)
MQLLCVGDVALQDKSLSEDVWAECGGVVPSENQKILFNWELAIGITKNINPRSSGPRLLAHPASCRVIKKWAPGFAALATNHILDAGDEGLSVTISTLRQVGFKTVGAGLSADEIQQPLIWETAEGRLAIINWVFPETHPDWMAVPGPNCWPGVDSARKNIQDLKEQADWVMVFAHWSDELFSYPRPEDRMIARELADMGTDIVVGHHPHVIRGMETIDRCPVFYSIGNYYFSNICDESTGMIERQATRNREGLGVLISFQHGMKPDIEFVSFWNGKRKVTEDPLHRAERRLVAVSQPLSQFSVSNYTAWYSSKRARFNKFGYRWQFRLQQYDMSGIIRYIFRRL